MSRLITIFKSLFRKGRANAQPTPAIKTIADKVIPISTSQYFSQGPIILPYPVDVASIEVMVNHSPILSAIITNLRNEVFRSPPELVEKFISKCIKCGHESEKVLESCPECGSKMRQPDKSQKRIWVDFELIQNSIGMTFRDSMEILEDDVNKFDDCYMIARYDYAVDTEGNILAKKLIEYIRGQPGQMRMIKDERAITGGERKGIGIEGFYTCVLHRTDNIHNKPGRCKVGGCGRKLHKCIFVALNKQGQEDVGYITDEVTHISKYKPSDSYGFSPVLSVWTEAKTLVNISRLTSILYEQHRPPKGFLLFRTKNIEAIQAQFTDIDERMKTNPLYIPKIAVDSESGGSRFAEWLPITPSQSELQTLDIMKEMRERIEAVYGVSNILMADTSASGGLNNEGLQLTVTLRTIERAQHLWEEKLFPWILGRLGITDWYLEFPPPVEKDEMATVQRRTANLQAIQLAIMMGSTVEITDETDFKFKLTGTFKAAPAIGSDLYHPPGGGIPGVPKTETERRATHQELYGTTDVPPRGTGWHTASISNTANNPDVLHISVPTEYGFYNPPLTNRTPFEKQVNTDIHFLRSLTKVFDTLLDSLEIPKKPTPHEATEMVKSIIERARGSWESSILSDYGDLIKKGVIEAGGTLKDLQIDMNALSVAASKESPLWNTYTDMGKELSQELNQIIIDSFVKPESFDIRKMRATMKKTIHEIVSNRLDTIARTETTAIVNKGRELAWLSADDGTQLYKFIHYEDFRLCSTCREIVDLIGDGKPLAVVKNIIKEVTTRKMGPNWIYRDWVVHPNCRGVLVKVSKSMSKGN